MNRRQLLLATAAGQFQFCGKSRGLQLGPLGANCRHCAAKSKSPGDARGFVI